MTVMMLRPTYMWVGCKNQRLGMYKYLPATNPFPAGLRLQYFVGPQHSSSVHQAVVIISPILRDDLLRQNTCRVRLLLSPLYIDQ